MGDNLARGTINTAQNQILPEGRNLLSENGIPLGSQVTIRGKISEWGKPDDLLEILSKKISVGLHWEDIKTFQNKSKIT